LALFAMFSDPTGDRAFANRFDAVGLAPNGLLFTGGAGVADTKGLALVEGVALAAKGLVFRAFWFDWLNALFVGATNGLGELKGFALAGLAAKGLDVSLFLANGEALGLFCVA